MIYSWIKNTLLHLYENNIKFQLFTHTHTPKKYLLQKYLLTIQICSFFYICICRYSIF